MNWVLSFRLYTTNIVNFGYCFDLFLMMLGRIIIFLDNFGPNSQTCVFFSIKPLLLLLIDMMTTFFSKLLL